jgi:hypothetical protein
MIEALRRLHPPFAFTQNSANLPLGPNKREASHHRKSFSFRPSKQQKWQFILRPIKHNDHVFPNPFFDRFNFNTKKGKANDGLQQIGGGQMSSRSRKASAAAAFGGGGGNGESPSATAEGQRLLPETGGYKPRYRTASTSGIGTTMRGGGGEPRKSHPFVGGSSRHRRAQHVRIQIAGKFRREK